VPTLMSLSPRNRQQQQSFLPAAAEEDDGAFDPPPPPPTTATLLLKLRRLLLLLLLLEFPLLEPQGTQSSTSLLLPTFHGHGRRRPDPCSLRPARPWPS
jgi:hypothetical protein